MSESLDFDYSKSALIVYNMQHNALKRVQEKIIPNIRRLIDAAHAKGIPVIYGQMISVPYEYQTKYFKYWLKSKGHDPKAWSEKMLDGAPATQILEDLKPAPQDLVIKKHVASFFVETNAEIVLRAKGVETIILCGVTTDHGIESTARHATFLGFMPVIVEDAVGSSREEHGRYSLALMKDVFSCDLRKTDYVLSKIAEI
jgi:nicotinamidase-related amidase